VFISAVPIIKLCAWVAVVVVVVVVYYCKLKWQPSVRRFVRDY
jgi:hypothetical protein